MGSSDARGSPSREGGARNLPRWWPIALFTALLFLFLAVLFIALGTAPRAATEAGDGQDASAMIVLEEADSEPALVLVRRDADVGDLASNATTEGRLAGLVPDTAAQSRATIVGLPASASG